MKLLVIWKNETKMMTMMITLTMIINTNHFQMTWQYENNNDDDDDNVYDVVDDVVDVFDINTIFAFRRRGRMKLALGIAPA